MTGVPEVGDRARCLITGCGGPRWMAGTVYRVGSHFCGVELDEEDAGSNKVQIVYKDSGFRLLSAVERLAEIVR